MLTQGKSTALQWSCSEHWKSLGVLVTHCMANSSARFPITQLQTTTPGVWEQDYTIPHVSDVSFSSDADHVSGPTPSKILMVSHGDVW